MPNLSDNVWLWVLGGVVLSPRSTRWSPERVARRVPRHRKEAATGSRLVSKSGGFTGKGIFFYAKRERDEYRVVFKIPASLRSLSGHVATDRYLGKVLPPRWTALVAAARGVSGGGNR